MSSATAVAQICRLLDDLVLELVAVRMRSLSPQQIFDWLTAHLPVLKAAPPNAPERQQALRSSIDWSYKLCSPAEHALWRRAPVFAATFDLDAAEQVCTGREVARSEMLDTIDGLLDKSVLVRIPSEDVVRDQMLETLREYGQERLETEHDRPRIERLHRNWIDQLMMTADAEWVTTLDRPAALGTHEPASRTRLVADPARRSRYRTPDRLPSLRILDPDRLNLRGAAMADPCSVDDPTRRSEPANRAASSGALRPMTRQTCTRS